MSIDHFGDSVEEGLKLILQKIEIKEFSEIPLQNVSVF